MKILFDVFIELMDYEKETTIEEKAAFEEIIKYFQQRLNPLKDEMETAEMNNTLCCVIIHLLPPEEEIRRNGNWYCEVVQRCEGVWVHHTGRWR